ncbi:MAG: TetR family transcriptional regulator [Myxococcota bacterium]
MTTAEKKIADPIVDQSGRVLGPRALGTRQRLLDASEALLARTRARDLKVVDIARAVDTSPATFYQYFKDVEDVLLALAKRASEEMPAVVHLIEEPWAEAEGLARARAVVDAFIRHWDEHQAVLRFRNMAADEGDERFARVRAQTLGPVLGALSRRIESGIADGVLAPGVHPDAVAAAMSAILERLAAYHSELAALGVTREDLIESSARILYRTLTGREAP